MEDTKNTANLFFAYFSSCKIITVFYDLHAPTNSPGANVFYIKVAPVVVKSADIYNIYNIICIGREHQLNHKKFTIFYTVELV